MRPLLRLAAPLLARMGRRQLGGRLPHAEAAAGEGIVRKIEIHIRVPGPVEDVYAYTSAVETMPEWRGDVSEAEQLTDGPLAVGTRIRAGGRVLGRPIGLVVEVTELEPLRLCRAGRGTPSKTIGRRASPTCRPTSSAKVTHGCQPARHRRRLPAWLLGVAPAQGPRQGPALPERVTALEAFRGWTWDPFADAWQEGLTHLQAYVEREGHARVPSSSSPTTATISGSGSSTGVATTARAGSRRSGWQLSKPCPAGPGPCHDDRRSQSSVRDSRVGEH